MNEERFNFFKKLTEDEKQALTYKDFTITEINEIIAETPLRDDDKRIAVMRYNKCMTYQEIADATFLDIKTVKKRIANISTRLKTTCVRLFV